MNPLNYLRRRWTKKHKASYSQCGEDLIAAFVFDALGISSPSYLDIGAHHPTFLSNTYLFYEQGHHGVNVEPDPTLCETIRRERGRDVCLNAGVGTSHQKTAEFYVMSARTLNTFSKSEAELHVRSGNYEIESVIQIPLLTINEIIERHFAPRPHFVSLDTEGMDLEILKTFDLQKYRPEVFCIETLTYPDEQKTPEVFGFMSSNGYFAYADTYINTIFVDQKVWKGRPRENS